MARHTFFWKPQPHKASTVLDPNVTTRPWGTQGQRLSRKDPGAGAVSTDVGRYQHLTAAW